MIQRDALAHVGHSQNRLIQTQLSDIQPKYLPREQLSRPSAEQVAQETEAARQALQIIIMERAAKTQPKNITTASSQGNNSTALLKYTPNATPASGNSSTTRLIQMVEMPKDPLEPPKFHHKRIPRPPPSPPAPRLHSPPRKVSSEEQRAWNIPPCVSSWKNPKGYTIPLDKRLATDGKVLQEKVLNNRIADFAEALYLAERHNKEEVEMRTAVERKLAEQEQRRQDEELERQAQLARLERERELERDREHRRRQEHLTPREREQRRRDEEREARRVSRLPPEERRAYLRSKTNVEEETRRDDTLIDDRVFDRTGGLGTGFGAGDDDVYNLYDRPLLTGTKEHLIYRPTVKSDHEATGVGESGEGEQHRWRGRSVAQTLESLREGPMRFEKSHTIGGGGDEANVVTNSLPTSEEMRMAADHTNTINDRRTIPFTQESEKDPFGLDEFLAEAKRGRKQ